MDWLHQEIVDLKLASDVERPCEAILAKADALAEKLPDTEVEGNAYATARQAMNKLFALAHDGLAKVLSAGEQSRLGPHFAELADRPATTQPAAGS